MRGPMIPVAPGELIDKITILKIKSERMRDLRKVENVKRELGLLLETRDNEIAPSDELERLSCELQRVNEALWDIEDEIRGCEHRADFGGRFVELARAVYHNNDERAAIKRKINETLGSLLIEEKSYKSYPPGVPLAT